MSEGARRTEILETAARLFGSSGIRTSLQEIADACGIQPGSLYHHFESKEAIIVELIRRYQAELDRLAEQAREALRTSKAPLFDQIVSFAEAISACAIQNRAAVLQTLYDPPAGASEEFARIAKGTPTAIDNAMLEILQRARAAGEIREGVELVHFADRICRSMLHIGIGLFHRSPAGKQVPTVRCAMMLEGIVLKPADDAALDASAPFAAAQHVIANWGYDDDSPASQLRAAARTEFGRRGYDATTMRDIASAAGMSTGMVYRLVGSKDELLTSIMGSYVSAVTSGWDAVLSSGGTPAEKLDALLWVDINALDRFGSEFKIQQAWLRQMPPSPLNLRRSFAKQLPQIKALLAEGERDGVFRVIGPSANVRANCLLELMWIPSNIVSSIGPRESLALARNTLLRGAAAAASELAGVASRRGR
jgi:AcrR family transcriptional regulator